jgi:Flp pilus assembly protein TadD
MALPTSRHQFEIAFFEGVLRRNARDTDAIEILGGLYTKEGRIDDGLRMDRRLVRLQPENATAHYNLACSLALKKRRADAMRSLERAVALGYRDAAWMAEDPDLQGIADHPAFRALLAKIAAPEVV